MLRFALEFVGLLSMVAALYALLLFAYALTGAAY